MQNIVEYYVGRGGGGVGEEGVEEADDVEGKKERVGVKDEIYLLQKTFNHKRVEGLSERSICIKNAPGLPPTLQSPSSVIIPLKA